MPDKYNVKEFESLYKETGNLRRSLARGIDPRILGLTPEEVYAEFNIKFIFAFQKYHDKHDYEVLKGHIITALQQYKTRLLKISLTQKYQIVKNSDPIEGVLNLSSEEEDYEKERRLTAIVEYMQKNLSPQAFIIFCIDTEPPVFIKNRMEELEKKPHSRIPAELIAEYLEWGESSDSLKLISKLRAEVRNEIKLAAEHFQSMSELD